MQRESSVRFLKHHSAPVKSVCFNPKERFQFASGGGDGKVNIYTGSETSFFDLIGGYQLQTPSNKNISGIRYMCDGRKILVSTSSKRISVVDVERGDQVQSFDNCAYPAHRERIPLAVDPICPHIAVCSCVNGRGLSLFDLRMPLPLEFLFELHTSVIRDIAFLDSSWPYALPNGNGVNGTSPLRSSPSAIVSLSIDGIVKITTLDNKLLHVFDVEHHANSLAITPEAFKSTGGAGQSGSSKVSNGKSRDESGYRGSSCFSKNGSRCSHGDADEMRDEAMSPDVEKRMSTSSSFTNGLPIPMAQFTSSSGSANTSSNGSRHHAHSHHHHVHGSHHLHHHSRHSSHLYSSEGSSFSSYFSPTSTLIPTNIAQQIHSVLSTHHSLPSLANNSSTSSSSLVHCGNANVNNVSMVSNSNCNSSSASVTGTTAASSSSSNNCSNSTTDCSSSPPSLNNFTSLIMVGGDGLSSFRPDTNAIERIECGYIELPYSRQCNNSLHSHHHHFNHNHNNHSHSHAIQLLDCSHLKDKGLDSSSSSSASSSSSSSPGLMSPSYTLPPPPPPPGTSSSSSSSWSHVSFPSSVITNSMSMYSPSNDTFITASNINLASSSTNNTTAASFIHPPASFASASASSSGGGGGHLTATGSTIASGYCCPVSPTSPISVVSNFTCPNCINGHHQGALNNSSLPLLPVQIWKLKYTSTGSFLYTASDDGSVKRYRRYPNGSHKFLGELFRHKGDVFDMDISSYDEFLVTASKDKQVGIICLGSPSHGSTGFCELT